MRESLSTLANLVQQFLPEKSLTARPVTYAHESGSGDKIVHVVHVWASLGEANKAAGE